MQIEYFNQKLNLIIRDLHLYTGAELSRELTRLAETASPIEELTSPHNQLSECQKDAERYRHLKENKWLIEMIDLDKAIDQAMIEKG